MSDFVTLTTDDHWFKKHPGKIAGVEVETTSIHFPIQVKGTKEDVLRVTGMDGEPKTQPGNKKLLLAKAKAKAIKIKLKLQQ